MSDSTERAANRVAVLSAHLTEGEQGKQRPAGLGGAP